MWWKVSATVESESAVEVDSRVWPTKEEEIRPRELTDKLHQEGWIVFLQLNQNEGDSRQRITHAKLLA